MKTEIKNQSKSRTIWFYIILCNMYILGCSQTSPQTHRETSTDKCLSPYFMVITEGSETEQLPLKSTTVDANIAGVIADVKVRQTYSNTGKNPIEAIYIFPASTRAAVYQMIMKINDREIIAIVEEKQKARDMYETAKQEGKTASLLEEQRPNVFQMNVANIMPGAIIEVTMSYTELLVPTDNIYEFIFPTVVGPRYVSNAEAENPASENWTANPYLHEGNKPTSTLGINVSISAGIAIKDILCTTHKNKINYTDKSNATVILDEKDGGNRDFIVDFRLAGNTVESGVLLYEDSKGEKYFLAMMQPPQRVNPEMVSPREYVFIVDVSGSMSGFPLEISKKVMENVLKGLKHTDKFNIVLFAGGSNVYSEKSLPATTSNIANAINYMKNLEGGGGTELLAALQTALKLGTDENISRSFVILTDGYVSVEKEAFDFIRNNLGNANFFAFGIGTSVNRFIIEGMAHVGYGEPFIAIDEAEGQKQAKKLISYISSPVLTNIDIKFSGFEAYEILPSKMPDLFAERPLIITGKYTGNAIGSIEITGVNGSTKYINTINFTDNIHKDKTGALKYLWAREKIRLLADYNNLQADDELIKEIVTLGKTYNLLTEYTSFVAIDSEVSNHTGNQTTVKQPLPLPEGVTDAAVGGSGNWSSSNTRMMKSSNYYAPVAVADCMELNVVSEEKEEEYSVYMVEEQPTFQGGDIQAFKEYLEKHIIYPEKAKKEGICGKVIIQFVIDEQGNITEVKIVKGINELLDNEALRIIKAAPKWMPGKQNGQAVKTNMVVPIEFKLT